MRIDFEDGVLKEAIWGGHIWVFLPVNIHATRHYPHLLGRVQIMGDAVNHLIPSSICPSPKSTPTRSSFTSSSSSPLIPDDIEIVEYIDEISCLTAGYIYKIPVSLPQGSSNSSSAASYNIPGGSSSSGKSTPAPPVASPFTSPLSKLGLKLQVPPPPKPNHHIVIAWIYDMIENK